MARTRTGVLTGAVVLVILGVIFGNVMVRVHDSMIGTAASSSSGGSITARVGALEGRMSLDEKIGQMTLISVSRLWGDCSGRDGWLQGGCLRSVLIDNHVGAILSGGGEAPSPNTPQDRANATNAIQRYAVQHSRLHIPILYGVDAVHGHNNVMGATIFPHNLGLAATWDQTLARAVAGSTARAVLATGIHWVYAPVADIARDLRWGRYYETFGEDPYLASTMVAAGVQGFQGPRFRTRVTATAKHFIGYSEPLGGRDRTFAELPLRYLREMYLPSFQGAVDAGVGTIMVNSGSVNEVPVHASRYLLTDVLRGQMGFKGVVVTDWNDIEALYTRYHYASSYEDAVRIAINAGIDMSMVPYDAASFVAALRDLVHRGRVTEARIDEAVRRILTLKFTLGLFEHPYVDAAKANAAVFHADLALARHAARESITLLKNQGAFLPLRKPLHSIVVTGPSADSVRNQMGGWTLGWQGVPAPGPQPPGTTVLDGIRREVGAHVDVRYVASSDPAEASRAAKGAEAAVVIVGEEPYAEGQGDTASAALPTAQQSLLKAIEDTGTPTVVVVIAGRPLMITDTTASARAVLMAWLPGTEGGAAVADVLFGVYDPSGRLPVSWPRTIGDVPQFYNYLPGTNGTGSGNGYVPLFPFGFGLSYAVYDERGLRATWTDGTHRSLDVSVNVTNTGKVAGDDVVQLYVHPVHSSILVPPRRLIGFAHVHLSPGGTSRVTMNVPISRLAVMQGDILGTGRSVVESGTYTLSVGSSQTRIIVA